MPDVDAVSRASSSVNAILGFDFGARRIGVAVGNRLTAGARALRTLNSRRGEPDWEAIFALVDEWAPDRLIVGMPYNMDGSEHALAPRIREFVAVLAERTRLPVETVDERLSSHEALERLKAARQSGQRRRIRRADIDRAAAEVILETWLNSLPQDPKN